MSSTLQRFFVLVGHVEFAVDKPLNVAALLFDAPTVAAAADDPSRLHRLSIFAVLIEAGDHAEFVVPASENKDVAGLVRAAVGHQFDFGVDRLSLAFDVDLHHEIVWQLGFQKQRGVVGACRVDGAVAYGPVTAGGKPVWSEFGPVEVIGERHSIVRTKFGGQQKQARYGARSGVSVTFLWAL